MSLTFERIKLHMVPFEGNVPYMYLCTAGRVTVGIGNMFASAAAAQSVGFVDRVTQNKASAEAIALDFDTISNQTRGRPHAKYRPYTKLDLPDVEINALFKRRIVEFEKSLTNAYANYSGFPDDAQLALLDMIFNLGPSGLKKFASFNKAVNEEDWITAAERCSRSSSTQDRNSGTKQLLEAAASAK